MARLREALDTFYTADGTYRYGWPCTALKWHAKALGYDTMLDGNPAPWSRATLAAYDARMADQEAPR